MQRFVSRQACAPAAVWSIIVGVRTLLKQTTSKGNKQQQRDKGVCRRIYLLRVQSLNTSTFPIPPSSIQPHRLWYNSFFFLMKIVLSTSKTFPALFMTHLFLFMECILRQALIFPLGKKYYHPKHQIEIT